MSKYEVGDILKHRANNLYIILTYKFKNNTVFTFKRLTTSDMYNHMPSMYDETVFDDYWEKVA